MPASPSAKTNRVMNFLFSCTKYMFTLYEQVSIKPGLLLEEFYGHFECLFPHKLFDSFIFIFFIPNASQG